MPDTPQSPDDFSMLNDFAHDLKTPLSSAMSFIDLAQNAGDREKQAHYMQRAYQALERIQQAVDDLLAYTRAPHQQLHLETCDLLEQVDDILDLLETQIDARRIRIEVDIYPTLQFVHADSKMLAHILQNLISNAIKYNNEGGRVQIASQEKGDYLQITIRDTGKGIPPELQERVFERFYRVPQKGENPSEGTGLGLAIVQTLVERLGGQIRLKSVLGEGSTFSFTLPRATASTSDFDREHADDLDDRIQESREQHKDEDTGLI